MRYHVSMFTSLRGKLIVIFIALTVSVVIVSSGFARYKQRQFALDRAMERAERDLQVLETGIHAVFDWMTRDLFMLRDLDSLHDLINADNAEQRKQAARETRHAFLALATYHKIFQQIRYLDKTGREVIRINARGGRIWATPEQELQNKARRYYFQQAITLKPGQFYVSPMDLNVENGKIEHPLTPVIRYAAPVTDQRGTTRGVLVLNVSGTTFFDLLKDQQAKAGKGTNYYLLNQDGYYLFHQNPDKTFGFMLDRQDNFFTEEPDLRAVFDSHPQGITIRTSQSTYHKTLYAFRHVNLPSATPNGSRYWILLTTVDNAELLMGMNEYIQAFVPFTILLILLCVAAAVFVAWNCSRPVVSLASAARKIHRGDLSARARVYTADDMGRFGHLFNEMAGKLEQTITRLRHSESKYRQIFENSRDCIFVTDTSCRIIDINAAGRRLLGIDPDQDLDQLSLNCCQQATEDGHHPAIRDEIVKAGYVKDYETWLTRADGTTRHCILTATSRYDEQGRLLGYEGILRDITEEKKRLQAEREFQKRLQEEVILAEERQRRHLGQVLHEEMAQNLALVNLKLQEAQTSLVHRNGTDARSVCDSLGGIRTLVQRMIHQIRTMIFDLYPTILDSQGLVPAMNWYSENFSRQTGIEISIYGESGSLGLSDSQKIYLFRSFKELLHNAWKHAHAKEVVATVKKTGHHIRLTVDDAGQGFDPQELESRGDELKGIGLVSIRQWVQTINGSMTIESEPGKGTRIAIDIPLDQEERSP